MKTLHTIEHAENGLTVKATQLYQSSYKGGHYSYVITNQAGHVVHVGQTVGGPPMHKLSTDDLTKILKDAQRWWLDEDRELYLAA